MYETGQPKGEEEPLLLVRDHGVFNDAQLAYGTNGPRFSEEGELTGGVPNVKTSDRLVTERDFSNKEKNDSSNPEHVANRLNNCAAPMLTFLSSVFLHNTTLIENTPACLSAVLFGIAHKHANNPMLKMAAGLLEDIAAIFRCVYFGFQIKEKGLSRVMLTSLLKVLVVAVLILLCTLEHVYIKMAQAPVVVLSSIILLGTVGVMYKETCRSLQREKKLLDNLFDENSNLNIGSIDEDVLHLWERIIKKQIQDQMMKKPDKVRETSGIAALKMHLFSALSADETAKIWYMFSDVIRHLAYFNVLPENLQPFKEDIRGPYWNIIDSVPASCQIMLFTLYQVKGASSLSGYVLPKGVYRLASLVFIVVNALSFFDSMDIVLGAKPAYNAFSFFLFAGQMASGILVAPTRRIDSYQSWPPDSMLKVKTL